MTSDHKQGSPQTPRLRSYARTELAGAKVSAAARVMTGIHLHRGIGSLSRTRTREYLTQAGRGRYTDVARRGHSSCLKISNMQLVIIFHSAGSGLEALRPNDGDLYGKGN